MTDIYWLELAGLTRNWHMRVWNRFSIFCFFNLDNCWLLSTALLSSSSCPPAPLFSYSLRFASTDLLGHYVLCADLRLVRILDQNLKPFIKVLTSSFIVPYLCWSVPGMLQYYMNIQHLLAWDWRGLFSMVIY